MNNKVKKFLENSKGENYDKLSKGEQAFYWLCKKNSKNVLGALVIDSTIWNYELPDFIKACKKYGVDKLIYSHTGSSALETIHYILSNGYTFVKTCVYKNFVDDEVKGLLLELNK